MPVVMDMITAQWAQTGHHVSPPHADGPVVANQCLVDSHPRIPGLRDIVKHPISTHVQARRAQVAGVPDLVLTARGITRHTASLVLTVG